MPWNSRPTLRFIQLIPDIGVDLNRTTQRSLLKGWSMNILQST